MLIQVLCDFTRDFGDSPQFFARTQPSLLCTLATMTSQVASKEQKDLALFRTAALQAAAGAEHGAALIAAPPGFWLVAAFVAASASALVALLVFGTYTQRETVNGYVAVTSGDLRIFPQVAGTVTGLQVSEGQSVAAGAPLFSLLASRNAGMQTAANRDILQAVTLERSALDSQAREQSLYFAAEDARLKQLVQNMAARLSVLQQQEQLTRQKSSIRQRDLERARAIQSQGHLSRRDLDALEVAALDSELQWRTASLQLAALEAERQDASARLEQLASLRGTRLAELAEASSRLAQRETTLRATVLQTVVAPVDGRVSALHVSEGQTLLADTLALSLMPSTAQFHAELLVPARSVGMLDEAARVQLRFDSYPFEKYGVYGATVERIARSLLLPGDARLPVVIAEPVYRVRATLDCQHVEVNGSRRALTAGITLKADILVSERTLFEWILAPVISAGRRL